MGGHSPAEIQSEIRRYWIVGMALFTLTVITVMVSYLQLSPAMAVFIALLVAVIKGSLVAAVFMHLISEKQAIYSLLLLTVVFFIFLITGPILARSGQLVNAG